MTTIRTVNMVETFFCAHWIFQEKRYSPVFPQVFIWRKRWFYWYFQSYSLLWIKRRRN